MSEDTSDHITGMVTTGEHYPDGWPVRPLDALATALYEPTRRNAKTIDPSRDHSFAALEEHLRDDYRQEAEAAQEFFAPKLRALEAERDALKECLSALEAHAKVYEEFSFWKGRCIEAWELEDQARLIATNDEAKRKYEPVRSATERLRAATAKLRELNAK
ncbi:MAG: hypothetical protein RIS45_1673 [Planctomycetota bacterium]|jgi:DNA repair exonuclease SbcCD ATPase subunit